jgi:hypothetical protein
MQPSYNSLRSVVRVPYALQPVDVIPASPHLVSAINRHDRVATLVELPQARSLKERQCSYRVDPGLIYRGGGSGVQFRQRRCHADQYRVVCRICRVTGYIQERMLRLKHQCRDRPEPNIFSQTPPKCPYPRHMPISPEMHLYIVQCSSRFPRRS